MQPQAQQQDGSQPQPQAQPNQPKQQKNRNGKKGKQATAQQQSTTTPTIISRMSQSLVPIVRPETSYYIVDFVTLVSVFTVFADYIVGLSRRGGWPLGSGYYCGLFIYALAAKLQRVGIASTQINPGNALLLTVAGLEIPNAVATLIDQFGEKIDKMGVRVVPYVTNNLITRLARFSYLLAGLCIDGVTPNPHTAIWVDANKYNLMLQCYGAEIYSRIGIAMAAGRLGTTCSLAGARAVDMNRTTLQMLMEYVVANNLPTPTLLEIDAVLARGVNVNTPGPFVAPFGVGAGPVAHGGNIPQAFAAAFNAVAAGRPNGADLFPNNNDQFVDATSITNPAGGWTAYQNEYVELAHRFHMTPVSVSPAGSFAPTVVTSEEGGYLHGHSVVSDLTILEWSLGLVLGADSVFVTRDGIPFNVSDRNRRNTRYSVTPLDMPWQAVAAAYIRTSMRNQ